MIRRISIAVILVAALLLGIVVEIQAQDGGNQLQPLPAGQAYVASDLEQQTANIYSQVVDSVVNVSVAGNAGPTAGGGTPVGTGTGFIIDQQGHIVTNNHVAGDASYIEVTFHNGERATATLVGNDPDADLAVILVDPSSLDFTLQPVTLSDSDSVFVGQSVLAIGSPYGQSFTLTRGIVSALGRQLASVSQFSIPMIIQTDAAINPGNSGGPLLNYAGQVIGVNTAILSESGSGSGVGFSVPSNTVRRIVPYLIQNGKFEHVWLGISGASVIPEIAQAMNLPANTTGVEVVDVTEGGPAAQAGLQGTQETTDTAFGPVPVGGDIITAINDAPVADMSDLITYLETQTVPGDQATLTVIRNGETMQIPVTLEARPATNQ